MGILRQEQQLKFCLGADHVPHGHHDYAVVRELSHIAYKNHNPGFWARIKTVMPNYNRATGLAQGESKADGDYLAVG
jgi:predicted metal-dependent hydrolase